MLDILSQSNASNPYLDLDFDLPCVIGNIDRLPQSIYIDNTPYAPCAYLVAQDINPSTGVWASRHDVSKTLSVAGAGAAPTYGNYTAIENTAVKYNAAKYHLAGDTTWSQVTTGDLYFECLYIPVASAVSYPIIFDTTAGGTTAGIRFCYDNTVSYPAFVVQDSGGASSCYWGATTTGTLQFVCFFVDRDYRTYMYLNGSYMGIVDTSTRTGSLTASALKVSSDSASAKFNGYVGHAALWNMGGAVFPGALKNRTYFDRIARERFEIVSGCQDQRGGSMSFTRATSGYLDRYISTTERRLFNVSGGWPRVCERKDANGLYVKGYLSEPQAQNKCVQSEDLATTWTATNITSVSANAIAAPTGNLTADGLVGDADNDVHDVYQAITCAASAHCFSVFAKKGNKDWIELYSNTTNVNCFFDINSGTVGDSGAGITASGIESFGNDWWRCYVIFTGSASAQNFHLRSAHADNDNSFAGDATTVNTYFWGAQVEAVTEYFPSSYIPTVAAAVTRNKDELTYNIKLPIVGNINDLTQTLNIGGTDYAPCAYLIADDCQADGTWTSRHGAKSLAFAGAGTNPTTNWSAVSRANRSVKYWASNYHQAADTTWGQVTSGDYAVEVVCAMTSVTGNTFLMSTYNGTTGIDIYTSANTINQLTRGSGVKNNVTATGTIPSGSIFHAFFGIDESVGSYVFINGVYNTFTPATNVYTDSTGANLAIGALASDGSGAYGERIILAALWDLTANPWPGAATNQAVMAAIARARFNQLFRYESCRLDCDILHPNVDAQTARIFVTAGNSANDYSYLGVGTNDYGLAKAAANAATQWDASTTVGAQDICDNVKIKLSTKARVNLASYVEDNTTIASDTTCELPAGQAKVWVGELYDGTLQPRVLISNVKLFRNDRK